MQSFQSSAAAVAAFNSLPTVDLAPRLGTCLQAPDWIRSMLAQRPFADRESILTSAYRLGVALTDEDLAAALSAHPRIGDRPVGPGPQAAHSRAEQAGVDAEDADLAQRLHAGNIAYEKRFGQVFLIRAAGRSGSQILAALEERLTNDPETELGIVRDQLSQIAQLRLTAFLDELGSTR